MFQPKYKASNVEISLQLLYFLKSVEPKFKKKTKNIERKKRRVSFHTTASVVLIPTKEEYKDIGIHSLVWYNNLEVQAMESKALIAFSFGSWKAQAKSSKISRLSLKQKSKE